MSITSTLNDTVLPDLSSVSYIYLASFVSNPTTTPTNITSQISTALGSNATSVNSLSSQLAAYQARATIDQKIVILMQFQFPFLLMIATFGILVVTVLTIIEKRREMALMRVKGVSEKQLIRVQLAEGFVLIVIGMIMGMVLGFPMAYLSNIQLDSLTSSSNTLRPFPSLCSSLYFDALDGTGSPIAVLRNNFLG